MHNANNVELLSACMQAGRQASSSNSSQCGAYFNVLRSDFKLSKYQVKTVYDSNDGARKLSIAFGIVSTMD